MNITTWRKELDKAGFDWSTAVLAMYGRYISKHDSILDVEFNSGYGIPEAPKVIAYDKEAIYLFDQFDGRQLLVKIYKDPDVYANGSEPIPDPGG